MGEGPRRRGQVNPMDPALRKLVDALAEVLVHQIIDEQGNETGADTPQAKENHGSRQGNAVVFKRVNANGMLSRHKRGDRNNLGGRTERRGRSDGSGKFPGSAEDCVGKTEMSEGTASTDGSG